MQTSRSVLCVLLLAVCAVHAIVLPRHKAPEFVNVPAVADKAFVKLSSSDFAGKWLVMLFYPFDFTYVCPTEVRASMRACAVLKCATPCLINDVRAFLS